MEVSELSKTIGDRIREEREERELKQVEFAATLGISPGRLCRIEKGERNIDTLVLRDAAEAFGLPMEALFEPRVAEPMVRARAGAGDLGAVSVMVEHARQLQRIGLIVERESKKYA